MDEIEEVVLTLTPYEAAVLRRLLELTALPISHVPEKRFPADQVVLDISRALGGARVPIATHKQCVKGNLDI